MLQLVSQLTQRISRRYLKVYRYKKLIQRLNVKKISILIMIGELHLLLIKVFKKGINLSMKCQPFTKLSRLLIHPRKQPMFQKLENLTW